MLAKAIIDHIFVQRAKQKALADPHTSDMDAEANPFIASAYVKQYTMSGLGVLLILLGHDLDPNRAGPISLLLYAALPGLVCGGRSISHCDMLCIAFPLHFVRL